MDDAKVLAAQSRPPQGEAANASAPQMNFSNSILNHAAINLLAVRTNERVLELGPGNAVFAPLLLQYPGSRYLGIELSPEKVAAGNRRLAALGLAERAVLQQGRPTPLPLEESSFDAALAVHATYFWPQLPPVLSELARVVQQGGRLCLAFADPAILGTEPVGMQNLHLHALEDVERALRVAGFIPTACRMHREHAVCSDGQRLERRFHLLLARRVPDRRLHATIAPGLHAAIAVRHHAMERTRVGIKHQRQEMLVTLP